MTPTVMELKRLHLLLVEDNPADAALMREFLEEAGSITFDLHVVERLSKALAYVYNHPLDLILTDLNLPDCQGIRTFVQIYQTAQEVPIIVLTGDDDPELAALLLRSGAQDYLVKGEMDSNQLVRAIRYAMERQQLMDALNEERRKRVQDQEMAFLDRISREGPLDVTARIFRQAPLREALPETFQELKETYSRLMDQALEQHTYKVDHQVSVKLRSLAEEMGFLKAGPRDVVEIHSHTLKEKLLNATPQKSSAYTEEGRLMVLELMGNLAGHYLKYAI